MHTVWRTITLITILWCTAISAICAESLPVKSGQATAQLVTTYDRAMPDSTIQIALYLRLNKHWHTYWHNAGGPGSPAELYWKLPPTLSVGDITWPLPEIVHTGPIVNYAFEDRLLLPMDLHISKHAKLGETVLIEAEAAYLVCYQVCLPESALLSLTLTIGEPIKDARWSANIERAIDNAPKPDESFKAAGRLEGGKFLVEIVATDLQAGQYKNPYFFPYVQDLINADDPQILRAGTKGIGLSMTLAWMLENGMKDAQMGVIAYDKKTASGWSNKGVIVTLAANTSLDIGGVKGAKNGGSSIMSIGFIAAIISALLGGIILNLMPCVFPILSLKALEFSKIAHENKTAVRRQGWFYTFGVLLSFLMLASALLFLKASGMAVGWGFQLQNPILVAILALLFFAISLNLLGMFEIGGRLQSAGGSIANTGGVKGAFFTGVLAVVVATPCTGPFMAGALGYAMAQPVITSLAVFLALGFGFALPFLLLSYAPNLLKRLPKPGKWMDSFKQLLAFPMLAAAIWLLWVLSHLAGADAAIKILLACLGFALFVWLLKRPSALSKLLALISIVFCIYLVIGIKPLPATSSSHEANNNQAWSTARVAELRAKGHPVFVDFTARWCVTCKVNERLVLNKQAAQDLFSAANTKVLIADWTRKDAAIARELARHGRSGVPLYLLYPPGDNVAAPQILPQTLTFKTLENALKIATD